MATAPRPPAALAAVTPMAFARAIVAAYRRHGRAPEGALREARITPAQLQKPDGRMTSGQMESLSAMAMQELDDESLGAFARPLRWGSYGLLARASVTAPDLRIALQRWCRHHGLLADDVRLQLTPAAPAAADTATRTATITVEELRPLPRELRELSLVFLLRNVHGLACWYVDSRVPLAMVALPFAAPAHADAYAHLFPGADVRFGAPRAELRFDARYLALPVRRDERAMRQMLQRALPLTVRQYRRDRLLVPQVRQLLLAQPQAGHDAATLARALHVSVRTLHRQLHEEGASLQGLKDAVRAGLAQDLLLRTERPLKQVAAAVGFRNEKSFARAFRTWTGVSPGVYRATGGHSASSLPL